MSDDSGEGLYVHAMLQCHGCEGVAQVVESDFFTLGSLQGLPHSAAGEVRYQRTIFF